MNGKRVLTVFLIVSGVLTAELMVLSYLWPVQRQEEAVEKPLKRQRTQEILDIATDRGDLQKFVEGVLEEDSEEFAIYLLRPGKEKQPWIYQSRPMRPASMIKLFVMAAAMQEVKDGKLSLDEVVVLKEEDMVGGAGILVEYEEGQQIPMWKVMELMITESDNTATNILIDRIGMNKIDQYLQTYGYLDTALQHKMMIGNEGRMNFSSVKDVGTLLTKIYYHDCVGDPYDGWMIDIMVQQKDRDCFPAALPTWRIAHKTGEIVGLYDDGGIFYGEQEDFVLVIMNDDYSGRDIAIRQMQQIARYAAGESADRGKR